jgi:hypothetical protein
MGMENMLAAKGDGSQAAESHDLDHCTVDQVKKARKEKNNVQMTKSKKQILRQGTRGEVFGQVLGN